MRFSTRVILTTIAIIVILGLLTMLSIYTVVQSALRRESSDKGLALAQVIADNVANALLDGNWYVAQTTLDDLMASNSNLVYAYILDPAQARVIHTFPSGFPRDLLTANRLPTGQRASLRLLDTARGPIRDIAWRILEGFDAELHLGFSEQGIAASANQVTLIIAALTLLGSLTRALNQMARDLNHTLMAMRRRNRELAALNATATATSGPLDVQACLESALTQSLASLDLMTGWVFLTDGDAPQLVTSVGLPSSTRCHAIAEGFPHCPCGQVLRDGKPMIIRDLGERCVAHRGESADGKPLCCHATVPVMAKGRILGVLSVASADPTQIGEEEMLLLEAVGRQLGVALENARLWQELEAKERMRAETIAKAIRAQEEERKRIARELHDQTGQSLNALVFGLKTVEAVLESDKENARQIIARLKGAAADAVRELQSIIYDLRPSVLDDLGLVPALRWLAESRVEAASIVVTLQVHGFERRLYSDLETTLFRIAQEALTNIVKHARARHAQIVLGFAPQSVTLEISDDGCGFDAAQVFDVREESGRGLGLLGMRERAELLGGQCQIESRIGQGTTVRVEIPL